MKDGETVTIKPHGNSMMPRIKSGQAVVVAPIDGPLKKGDVVLCKVKGNTYLHLVKQVGEDAVLIGNNKGRINGWTKQVFGKALLG